MTPEEQNDLREKFWKLEDRLSKLEVKQIENSVNKLEAMTSEMRSADLLRQINDKLDRILKHFGISET